MQKIKSENVLELIPEYLKEDPYFREQLSFFLPVGDVVLNLLKYRGENYTVYYDGPFNYFYLDITDDNLLKMESKYQEFTLGINLGKENEPIDMTELKEFFSSIYVVKEKSGTFSISKRTIDVSNLSKHTEKAQEFEKLNYDALGNLTKINKTIYVPEYFISKNRKRDLMVWNKGCIPESEENWYFLNHNETIGEVRTRGASDCTYYFKSVSSNRKVKTEEISQEDFASYLDKYYTNKAKRNNPKTLKKKLK